jgi:hypothetical protein
LLLVPEPLTASGKRLAQKALPDQFLQALPAQFTGLRISYAVQIWAQSVSLIASCACLRIPFVLCFLLASFVVFCAPFSAVSAFSAWLREVLWVVLLC